MGQPEPESSTVDGRPSDSDQMGGRGVIVLLRDPYSRCPPARSPARLRPAYRLSRARRDRRPWPDPGSGGPPGLAGQARNLWHTGPGDSPPAYGRCPSGEGTAVGPVTAAPVTGPFSGSRGSGGVGHAGSRPVLPGRRAGRVRPKLRTVRIATH